MENKPVITSQEREVRRGRLGVWDEKMQTTLYKIDEQQAYIVQYREL